MGDLIRTPYSEVTATLEILDRLGVGPEHLERFRKASSYVQAKIADALISCDERFFTVLQSSLPAWREEDGVIYFSVTSDGTTSEGWMRRLYFPDFTKQVFRSSNFTPTNGVTTEVAVLRASLFAAEDLFGTKVRAAAAERGFTKPNIELACLIRMKFTNMDLNDMGLDWILPMHGPVDVNAIPRLLYVRQRRDNVFLIDVCDEGDQDRFSHGGGFAFVAPQTEQLAPR